MEAELDRQAGERGGRMEGRDGWTDGRENERGVKKFRR